MKKYLLPLVLALAFGLANVASGQDYGDEPIPEKPEAYPTLEVQRPLLIPRGTFEIKSEFSYLSTIEGFDDSGKNHKLPESWDLFSMDLKLGYGVFKWWEVGVGLPYYSGDEVYAKGQSLGDVYMFNKFRALEGKNKDWEVAPTFRISFPTGEPDRVLTVVNGQFFPEDIRTGDPSIDLYPGVLARWTYKNMALRANLEYGYRFEGKIKTGVEALETSHTFAPGQSLSAGIDFLYQIHSKIVILASLGYFQQDANKLAGESLDDAQYLLGVMPGVEFQLLPDYEILLKTNVPVAGKNSPMGYPIILGINARF